ncbi:MAG: helix-turn-helix domain-containing protein [Bacteroidota bacterium]
MTEKQEKILKSALKLFAEQGYNATSTSKIAKDAKVSEALIFRHFQSKEGLLEAVLAEGEKRLQLLYADILIEPNPKTLLRKTLEMPFDRSQSSYDFWRLQFKLKWELEYSSKEKLQPIEDALQQAFRKLNYPEPEMEAEYMVHFLEGLSTALIRNTLSDATRMKHFLLKKYDLQ